MSFLSKIHSSVIKAYDSLRGIYPPASRWTNITTLVNEALELSRGQSVSNLPNTLMTPSTFTKIDKIYNQVIKHIKAFKDEKSINSLKKQIETLKFNLENTTITEPTGLIDKIYYSIFTKPTTEGLLISINKFLNKDLNATDNINSSTQETTPSLKLKETSPTNFGMAPSLKTGSRSSAKEPPVTDSGSNTSKLGTPSDSRTTDQQATSTPINKTKPTDDSELAFDNVFELNSEHDSKIKDALTKRSPLKKLENQLDHAIGKLIFLSKPDLKLLKYLNRLNTELNTESTELNAYKRLLQTKNELVNTAQARKKMIQSYERNISHYKNKIRNLKSKINDIEKEIKKTEKLIGPKLIMHLEHLVEITDTLEKSNINTETRKLLQTERKKNIENILTESTPLFLYGTYKPINSNPITDQLAECKALLDEITKLKTTTKTEQKTIEVL